MDTKLKSSTKEAIVMALALIAIILAMTVESDSFKTCPKPSKVSVP